MINPDKVIKAFEEKFDSMSYEERESYLKKNGFSFETTTLKSEVHVRKQVSHSVIELKRAKPSCKTMKESMQRRGEKASPCRTVVAAPTKKEKAR